MPAEGLFVEKGSKAVPSVNRERTEEKSRSASHSQPLGTLVALPRDNCGDSRGPRNSYHIVIASITPNYDGIATDGALFKPDDSPATPEKCSRVPVPGLHWKELGVLSIVFDKTAAAGFTGEPRIMNSRPGMKSPQ